MYLKCTTQRYHQWLKKPKKHLLWDTTNACISMYGIIFRNIPHCAPSKDNISRGLLVIIEAKANHELVRLTTRGKFLFLLLCLNTLTWSIMGIGPKILLRIFTTTSYVFGKDEVSLIALVACFCWCCLLFWGCGPATKLFALCELRLEHFEQT